MSVSPDGRGDAVSIEARTGSSSSPELLVKNDAFDDDASEAWLVICPAECRTRESREGEKKPRELGRRTGARATDVPLSPQAQRGVRAFRGPRPSGDTARDRSDHLSPRGRLVRGACAVREVPGQGSSAK